MHSIVKKKVLQHRRLCLEIIKISSLYRLFAYKIILFVSDIQEVIYLLCGNFFLAFVDYQIIW